MITFKQLEVSNFGVLTKASVPLDGQGLVLIRGVNADTTAASSNGSGKTTVFKALSWCLFGEVVGDGRVTNEVIRQGSKKAQVEVTFDDGTHEYRVERSRTPSGGKLTLYTDGVSTTGRTAKDTEARICELLGLDWHAFRNTVLYGQGDIKRFADKHTTDSERKSILKRVLRLDVYDKAREEAKQRLAALRLEVAAVQTEHTKLGVRLEDARLNRDSLVSRHGTWHVQSAAEAHRMREDALKAREQADTYQSLIDDAEAIKKAVEQLDARLSNIERVQSDRNRLTDRLDEARQAHQDAVSAFKRAESILFTAKQRESVALDVAKSAKRARDDMSADTCPTCGQGWPEGVQGAKQEEAAQAAEQAFAKVVRLREDIEDAEAHLAAEDDAKRAAYAEMEDARRKQEEVQKILTEQRRWEVERDAKRARLSEMDKAVTEVTLLERRASDLERLAQEKLDQDNPFREPMVEAQELYDEVRDQYHAKDAEADKLLEGEAPLKWWIQAFSDKGLPSLAMDNVMPILTESANGYLDILSDGDITVDISTEKALKGGGTRDNITITQTIEGLADVTPSGGQRSKMSLAVDLGLMDVVASREGAEINLMMLDEVLDGLDDEGKARVVELLQHLRTVRPSLFVVSHDDTIQEHFEKVITVTKRGGKSTVEEQ